MTTSILTPPAEARGLINGTVTLLLRVVKPQPTQKGSFYFWEGCVFTEHEQLAGMIEQAPWRVGDIVPVKETWQINHIDFDRVPVPKMRPIDPYTNEPVEVIYRADGEFGEQFEIDEGGSCWRPSVHMPAWAVRTHVRVISVACSRVGDLKLADLVRLGYIAPQHSNRETWQDTIDDFKADWTRLHGPDAMMLWVWVIGVERCDA